MRARGRSKKTRRSSDYKLSLAVLLYWNLSHFELGGGIMGLKTTYKARTFDLSDLTGISNETLAMHFKLYEGYVTNTNTLNTQIAELIGGGELDATKVAAFSELRRRYGFEYNGMVLHEYYFENMVKNGTGDPGKDSAFAKAAEESFGSY